MRLALFAALLVGPACSKVTCGEGTVLNDKTCDALVECGPGTVFDEGECLPDDALACGEGTVRRGEECVPVPEEWAQLPFVDGAVVHVGQGNHGAFSHKASSVHALDFPLPEGTQVAAIRGGKVLRVRDDSDEGCGDVSCANMANYVYVDHGDGTVASYLHLQRDGALVDVGDDVVAGDVIALTGNTGFSTGPHLHLEVRDLYRQSLPVRFEDLRDISEGYAFAGVDFVATKQPDVPQGPFAFSDCQPDTFGWMGVTLDPGFPCAAVQAGERYTLSGVQHGDDAQVKAGTWVYGEWDSSCADSSGDGRFSVEIVWPADATSPYSYLMVGASKGNCRFPQSWSDSVQVRIHE